MDKAQHTYPASASAEMGGAAVAAAPRHTPGPWGLAHNGWANAPWVIYTGTPPRFDRQGYPTWPRDDASWVITEVTENEMEEHAANARLIVSAPAMKLALDLICAGSARIERTGKLEEFCFDGLRYCMNGDWSALMKAIGWDKACAAIAKASGPR